MRWVSETATRLWPRRTVLRPEDQLFLDVLEGKDGALAFQRLVPPRPGGEDEDPERPLISAERAEISVAGAENIGHNIRMMCGD